MDTSVEKNFILKHPKTEKDAANLIRVDKYVGLSRFAVQDDIAFLMLKFKSKSTHTIKDFEECWYGLRFHLVHYSCLQKSNRKEFMSEFYSCTLDYLQSPLDLHKSAVIYTLYFLYFSQPKIWDSVRIRVNKGTWSILFDFYANSIEQEKNDEAAIAFDQLKQKEAFEFVANEKIDSSSILEREEFKEARAILDNMHKIHLERIKKDEIETFLDADDYKILTEEYKDAKKHALSTPHLTKLAQKFFREELHVEETNTDRLMKYVQATGLMDDTELSIEISSKRRMTERLESISSRNEKKKKEWSEKYGLQPL